jgi:hypothetical protein
MDEPPHTISLPQTMCSLAKKHHLPYLKCPASLEANHPSLRLTYLRHALVPKRSCPAYFPPPPSLPFPPSVQKDSKKKRNARSTFDSPTGNRTPYAMISVQNRVIAYVDGAYGLPRLLDKS